MDPWLIEHLVCPRDKSDLDLHEGSLVCNAGHSYPVIQGIPVMLLDDAESTHGYIEQTLESIADSNTSEAFEAEAEPDFKNGETVDEFVQKEIVYTSGNLYYPVEGKLPRYPIPRFVPPNSDGERLLDIGCNWGRWSIAAARKGYRPVGIDPSLKAVLAAKRVASQLGVEAIFAVGDARFLPFAEDSFDVVFSYGVFQHFAKENTRVSLDEISRVLKPGHKTYLQMPNRYGVRQYYQHWRRGFTEGEGFEIRYWTPKELRETFEDKFGKTEMSADCYFGLGIQKSDVDLMPLKYKAVVHASELLRKTTGIIPPLMKFADSVYLESVNEKN
ncbi:MAG: methyltransferase domain-containing protein [Pyrinomonadaceae bacterium]|nr:methyltransferase domain-containing protein [Pyrinomonadaceae bacterium]